MREEDGVPGWRPDPLLDPKPGQLVCAICGQRHPLGTKHAGHVILKPGEE